jgi:hypothetical protein
MVGQHPQLYSLPEVNLFVAETMSERQVLMSQPRFLEDGLLRAVAELFGGAQTLKTVALARRWVEMRQNSPCVAVFRELGQKVAPRRLVDKSIPTVLSTTSLDRIRRAFPAARYLHLLRHPLAQGESLAKGGGEIAAEHLSALDYSTTPPTVDFQKTWYTIHVNIVSFLNGLPAQQWLRLQGEAILSNPDQYLGQIAQWLGISTDRAAIEAMKHPENSPFASLGPLNAPFGNDPKFLRDPHLRNGSRAAKPLSLDVPLPWRDDGQGFTPEVKHLAWDFGYR